MKLLGALEQHYTFLILAKVQAKGGDVVFDDAIKAVQGLKKRQKEGDRYNL